MQLYNIAFNNFRQRKAKMLFVLSGLVIGIAAIVSVYSVVEAMQTEMARQATEFGANVIITADAGELAFSYGGFTLPEVMFDVEKLTNDDVAAIEGVPLRSMIRAVAPKLLGVVGTSVGRVIVMGGNLQEEFRTKPWLRLRIVHEEPGDPEESPGGTDGAEVQDGMDDKYIDYEKLDLAREDVSKLVLADDEVLIGKTIAVVLNVAEGDHLTLGGREFRVFAVLEENGSAEDNQILMNLPVAQSLLDRTNEVTVIDLTVDYSLGSEEALLGQLGQALPNARIVSLRQEALRRDQLLTRLIRFGTAVSILILFVGTLVVALTMSGAMRERTREVGIFRAIGFRKSHITKIVLLEGLFVSIPGGIIGYLFGMLAAIYGGPFLTGTALYVPWRFDLLVSAVIIAIVVALVASIYTARQASRLDPMEALCFF
ncbi:MAG TPA: FtsX-like permease family protein [Candidatus Limnocylindrales bacterium]|nr:FtsX-like permease family protein [Candidatus Limnocylindrales bacterium]